MSHERVTRRSWVAMAAVSGLVVSAGSDRAARAGADGIAQRNSPDTETRFDTWFGPEAMRVDLFQTGTSEESVYSLDEVVREPIWPGPRRQLVCPFTYGTYRYRVRDAETGREILSQGYSTLFEEWMGTAEAARGVRRTMSESVRFPWPHRPVLLEIEKRVRKGRWEHRFSIDIDPRSHQISSVRAHARFEVVELAGDAPPERALDIVIVPEGYAESDRGKLRADLDRFTQVLWTSEPFRSLQRLLHVRGVMAISSDSGITEPRKGIFRDTVLGATFNTFDSPRYLTVQHTKALRQIASLAPYDTILVMANTSRYGGGGVFHQWAVFASDNEYDDYLLLHEWGHALAGLGDEYYSSAIASDEDALYPPGDEPWEPNLSAFLRGRDSIKWRDLIDPAIPVPTPEQDGYGAVVGLFEGAGYKAKGLYRPQLDCKMFHKGLVDYCRVCRDSIERMVRYHAGEDVTP